MPADGDTKPDPAAADIAANVKARDDLRAVAKWVVGGVMATVAGVVVGTPLTSLSALEWGPRLWLAIGAAAVALGALGLLAWQALNVIAPSSYSLPEIVLRGKLSRRRLAAIDKRLEHSLPYGEENLTSYVTNGIKYGQAAQACGASAEDKKLAEDYRKEVPYITSSVIYENLLISFLYLKLYLLFIGLVLFAAIIVYTYAVNPRDSTPVRPYLKKMTVVPDDMATLRSSFSPSECLTQPLEVIVLGERSTGVQDVVTAGVRVSQQLINGGVVETDCRPVRLRLDAGRLTAQ